MRDRDIIQALGEDVGDRALWGELYRRHWPAVYYTLYKLTRGEVATARDLAHETFLAFLERAPLGRIPDEGHASAYLRQTARRLYMNHRRKARRLVDSASDEGASALALAAYDDEDQKHLKWDLERLASNLREADRRLLQALMQGFTIDEIAAREGTTYGTAAVRVYRLRERIRLLFSDLRKLGNESAP